MHPSLGTIMALGRDSTSRFCSVGYWLVGVARKRQAGREKPWKSAGGRARTLAEVARWRTCP